MLECSSKKAREALDFHMKPPPGESWFICFDSGALTTALQQRNIESKKRLDSSLEFGSSSLQATDCIDWIHLGNCRSVPPSHTSFPRSDFWEEGREVKTTCLILLGAHSTSSSRFVFKISPPLLIVLILFDRKPSINLTTFPALLVDELPQY